MESVSGTLKHLLSVFVVKQIFGERLRCEIVFDCVEKVSDTSDNMQKLDKICQN